MADPVWCSICRKNVIPDKEFNWLTFFFLCLLCGIGGLFYLIFYWLKKPICPICGGRDFSPAKPINES